MDSKQRTPRASASSVIVLHNPTVLWWVRVVLIVLILALYGCGGGIAALVVALTDSDRDDRPRANFPAEVKNLHVSNTKSGPARICFTLIDREGDSVDVSLYYTPPGAAAGELIPILLGDGQLEERLDASEDGIDYCFEWDFASQVATGPRVGEGYIITVKAGDRILATSAVNLGNDAPQVDLLPGLSPGGAEGEEVVGIVNVPFVVSDTSDDFTSVIVEYAIVEDGRTAESQPTICELPDDACDPADRVIETTRAWTVARPAGSASSTCIPVFAFFHIQAPRAGRSLDFFWDVVGDLGRKEADIKLRFTPCDGLLWGKPVETAVFRVDNNDAPVAELDGQSFVLNPDRGGGIPIPFEVWDNEGDAVRAVFQWRLDSQSFDDIRFALPASRAELESLLADPTEIRNRQIATEKPCAVTGRVIPQDGGAAVRLPELAASAATLLAKGMDNRVLEILRPATVSQSGQWELQAPVAALPARSGTAGLVLDTPGAGSWRLRELDLATGQAVTVVVDSGSGDPRAMAFEPGEETVLVATDVHGQWSVWRVQLQSGGVTLLISVENLSGGDGVETGAIRSIVSVGNESALITVGSSLVRLIYPEGEPVRAVTILDDLQTPWGIVIDPLTADRIYLAEHGWQHPDAGEAEGRLIAIQLGTLARTTIRSEGLRRPGPVALHRWGTCLLVVTDHDPLDGTCELLDIDLARGSSFEATGALNGRVNSLATGSPGLTLMALTDANALALGGGIEQRRTIQTYDVARQTATVDAPFDPPLHPSKTWRIFDVQSLLQSTPDGTPGTFVWDSHDVSLNHGRVVMRVVPYDSEMGTEDSSGVPRSIIRMREEPLVLVGPASDFGSHALVAADLDGDGDLDLAAGNTERDGLTVVFQRSPGVFGDGPASPTPDLMVGGAGTTTMPVSILAADLDGDGTVDLASGNRGSNTLTVFLQKSPGVFGNPDDPTQPDCTVGGAGTTAEPVSIAAADVDGDGRLDLIAANAGSNTLAVFFQKSPGVFGNPDDPTQPDCTVGGAGTTAEPVSIAAADIDTDGRLDLIAANAGSDTLTIFFQKSPGVFGEGGDPAKPNRTLGGSGITDGVAAVVVADLNGDSHPDIASSNAAGDTLTLFFQEGIGAFGVNGDPSEPQCTLGGSKTTGGPADIIAVDMDGDGDMDLVSANATGHTLTIFVQHAPGVFASEADPSLPDLTLGGPGRTDRPASVVAADLDGDGDVDLAATNAGSRTLTWFPQRMRGTSLAEGDPTQPDLVLGAPLVTEGPRSVVIADLDSDGDVDLASANGRNNTLTVFFQKTPGVFGLEGDPTKPNLTLGGHAFMADPRSLVAADLNGDGAVDLASTNFESDTLTIFLQNIRTGNRFNNEPDLILGSPETTDGPLSLVAADFNGDSSLDLAFAAAPMSTVVVFFQTEAGSFVEEGGDPTVPHLLLGDSRATPLAESVMAVDLDGVGGFDIISGNFWNKTLTVFLQKGRGEFGDAAQPDLILGGPETTNHPVSIASADLDRDGDLDLISANYASGTLTGFYQNEPGVFGTGGDHAQPDLILGGPETTGGPVSVLSADIDGDGNEDCITGNTITSVVTVFCQRSHGVFGQAGDASAPDMILGGVDTTGEPRSVAVADLDGDGDLDVVTANSRTCTLTVFYGGH